MIYEFTESKLKFKFYKTTIQYDTEPFYRKYCEDAKAVDFLSHDEGKHTLILMEVKNFTGHESEKDVRERLHPNGTDPLDKEIAEKVRDTVAVLYGASRCSEKEHAERLKEFYKALIDKKEKIIVIAFIEGKLTNYGNGHTNGEVGLRRKIEKRVRWLNCSVMVMNTESSVYNSLMDVSRESM